MIRFRRLYDISADTDRKQMAEIQKVFWKVFPYDPATGHRIASVLADRTKVDFEPILLAAENEKSQVLGFAFTYYFTDIRYGYLDYIASDPDRPARGIGGALYDATREHLVNKEAHGMFFDVPPDEPEKLKDPMRLAINRKRLRFYERYGARPILGTLYDSLETEANEGWLTFMAYDPLGRKRTLHRAEFRKALTRIYGSKYNMPSDHPQARKVIASVRDDPVKIRPPRYIRAERPGDQPVRRGLLRPLKVVVVERHELHHLRERGYVERPVRIEAVMRGLQDVPIERLRPHHFGDKPIRAVHDSRFVSYLIKACSRLAPRGMIYPTVFPIRRPERRPKELEMRAGYFCADTFTPLTHNAYVAARAAVDCALTGAELLLDGEQLVYSLCRPPGHHAERAVFGGFCYFNNSAVAAHHLSAHGKVALLDVDYHHGNGAQDIFYRRRDVLTVSIHGHPNTAYPYFSGFADERGEDEGVGFNRNFPLRPGADDVRYLEALDQALEAVRKFAPNWFVISLGFDTMRGDPTGTFVLSTRGIREVGERIGRMKLPTLVVQEGGYSRHNLRRGARAFFSGLVGAWY